MVTEVLVTEKIQGRNEVTIGGVNYRWNPVYKVYNSIEDNSQLYLPALMEEVLAKHKPVRVSSYKSKKGKTVRKHRRRKPKRRN